MSNIVKPYRWSTEMRLAATALINEMSRAAMPHGWGYRHFRHKFLSRYCMVQVDETTMGLAPPGERPSDGQLRRVWATLMSRGERVRTLSTPLVMVRERSAPTAYSSPRPSSTHYKPAIEAFYLAMNRELMRGHHGPHLLVDETPLAIAMRHPQQSTVRTVVDEASGKLVELGMSGMGKSWVLGNGQDEA